MKKRKLRKRARPFPPTPPQEQKIKKLQRLLLEEPTLNNYIEENQKLKFKVSCMETKHAMLKEQLIKTKVEVHHALLQIKRLEKLLNTEC